MFSGHNIDNMIFIDSLLYSIVKKVDTNFLVKKLVFSSQLNSALVSYLIAIQNFNVILKPLKKLMASILWTIFYDLVKPNVEFTNTNPKN